MSKKGTPKILEDSCGWIRRNWNAKNLDVPPALVEVWIYEPDEDLAPSGFHLGVFMFGYLQYQLVSTNSEPGQVMSVSSERAFELFQAWQMKLAMAEVNRLTDVRVAPMPLFDFPADEQIKYWRVGSS